MLSPTLNCNLVFCFPRNKSHKVEDPKCCKTMNYNMYSRAPPHSALKPPGGDALALACIWAGILSHKSWVVWSFVCLVPVSVGSHFLLEQRTVTRSPLLSSLGGQGCDEHLLCAKIARQGREKGKRRLWAHVPKWDGGCCRQHPLQTSIRTSMCRYTPFFTWFLTYLFHIMTVSLNVVLLGSSIVKIIWISLFHLHFV